jgi:hypothetical protein
MKSLAVATLFFILISCDSKKEKGSDFTEYINQLPTLSLPLNLDSCKIAVSYDTVLFRKFKNKNSVKPCGKILMGDSIILLIDEAQYGGKLLRTFTQAGIEVQSISIIHGSAYYHGNQSVTTATIDRAGKITSTNSRTEANLIVTKRQWDITREGRFTGGNEVNLDSITIRQLVTNFLDWHFDTTRTKLQLSQDADGMMTLLYEDQAETYKKFNFSSRFLKDVKKTCEECKNAIKSISYKEYEANGNTLYNEAYLLCKRATDWVRSPDAKYCGNTMGYKISDITFDPQFPGYEIPPGTPCVVINFDMGIACGVVGLIQFRQIQGRWQIDDIASMASLYGE